MKYSKYFGAKRRRFIKSISVLAPKGTVHLLNENIRYDTIKTISLTTLSIAIKKNKALSIMTLLSIFMLNVVMYAES